MIVHSYIRTLGLFILGSISLSSIAQEKKLTDAIKRHAHPIVSPTPLSDNSDLAFLKDILKDKTVIGLGEATHGTREFFQMKHRLLKFLVEEMGYRQFAIESNFAECMVINDYVRDGVGDPEMALRGIYFWTWNTDEVLDMVKWMRAYNVDKTDKDKVQFLGFDMQYTYGAANKIKEDLEKYEIDYHLYKETLDSMATNKHYGYEFDAEGLKQLSMWAGDFYKYSNKYSRVIEQQAGRKEFEMHRQYVNTLLQAIENKLPGKQDGFRDSCMAINLKWLTEYSGDEKIVVWAHNGHLCKNKMSDHWSYYQMGYWLSQLYGSKYYAIGFDFDKGQFRSKEAKYISETTKYRYEMKTFTISKTIKNTTNYVFSKANLPIFFLDHTEGSSNATLNDFLHTNTRQKLIGAAYYDKWENTYYFNIKLANTYDATLFFQNTTASVPITSYTKYIEELTKK